MNKVWAMLACGLLALPSVAAGPGTLTVDDRAKAFTADGVAKAKALMESADFHAPAHLVVVTGGDAEVPAAFKADLAAAKGKKDRTAGLRVIGDWAADEALKHRDKGVFVLVYTQGESVLVKVKADKTTDVARGFHEADDTKLAELFAGAFKAGQKDKGLYEATAYVVDHLKNTTVPEKAAPVAAGGGRAAAKANNGGYSVGSLICFGLVAVLGIWLVVGLIRSFTQPRGGYGPQGGYGGGGYGGGGGGYGGGGGGFMSGIMGGLFGAVAGNYLYNNFMGGSSLGAGGMDGGGYDGAGGMADATGGDGDYAGGSEGGAGDFGGGSDDAGYGGDAGGDYGGSDSGGGGDFGGGGGDFGGDSGGGGDW